MKYIKRFIPSAFMRKNDGSAIIEFAVVAPVFFLIMFGVTEFGFYMYQRITIERIAVEVSRIASITKTSDGPGGACPDTTDQIGYITCIVKSKASALINGDRVQVQVGTLAAGGTSVPDICLDDASNPSSAPATCTIYEDVDGNGSYKGAGASDAGTYGDTIEVRISYPMSVMFPIMRDYIGSPGHKGIVMISSSTIIRNEPK